MKALFFLIIFICAGSQEFRLLKKIQTEGGSFVTDHLGNLYTVDGLKFAKYNPDGEETAHYSNAYYGEISYADVTDPYRILLYYRDFNQILFLDKELSEIASPIFLSDLSVEQATIACTSNRGGFWVYDRQTTQLLYFNKQLEQEIQSVPLNTVCDASSVPGKLIEKNEYLYINFQEYGILVFDRFGSFFKKIPLLNLTDFQVTGDRTISYFDGKSLFHYDHVLKTTECTILPDTMGVLNAHSEQNRLYLSKPKTILIYTEKK